MSLPQSEIAYEEAHINDDIVYQAIVVCVVSIPLAILAVALRFVSRRLSKAALRLDDWLILAALFFHLGFIVVVFLCVRWGLGRHLILLTDPFDLMISFLMGEVLYIFIVTLIKLSILHLYRRIFIQRWFRRCLLALEIVLLINTVMGFVVDFLQCIPLRHLWDPSVPATCIDFWAFVLGSGVINTLTDFMVLALPIRPLLELQVSKSRRIQLFAVFLVGGLTCIAGTIRLGYCQAFGTIDITYNSVPFIILTTLECTFGIIAACAPTFGLFITRFNSSAASRSPPPSDPLSNNTPNKKRIIKTTSIQLSTVSKPKPTVDRGGWESIEDGEDGVSPISPSDVEKALHPQDAWRSFVSAEKI